MPTCEWRRARRTQDLRLAYGGLRGISGAGEAERSCCIVTLTFRMVRSGQQRIRRRQVTVGEHAKADRDSPEFFVLRRVNESRRGSASGLDSAGIPAHPRPHTRFINSFHV